MSTRDEIIGDLRSEVEKWKAKAKQLDAELNSRAYRDLDWLLKVKARVGGSKIMNMWRDGKCVARLTYFPSRSKANYWILKEETNELERKWTIRNVEEQEAIDFLMGYLAPNFHANYDVKELRPEES